MQITRPAQHFAHFDQESGEILGLYNSNRHTVIPEPRAPITVAERDAIQSRPQDFRIDSHGYLVEITNSNDVPDVTETYAENRSVYERTIGCGVIVDDVCYYADDEASAHITQCLAIASASKHECKLKAVVEGKARYVPVKSKDKLVKIAIAVNELRTKAKEKLLEDDAVTLELSQNPSNVD